MAKSYNLTLQLNLQGPSNIGKVTKNLKKQLQGIGGSLKIDISKASLGSMDQGTKKLAKMAQVLKIANTNAVALNKTFQDLSKSISNVNSVNSNINKTSAALQKTSKAAKSAKTEVKSFWEELVGRADYQARFNTINAALSGINQTIQLGIDSLIEYERNLNKISQLGTSARAISSLDKEIRNLSQGLGISSTELSNVSVVLKQAGQSATDTKIALKSLSQASLAPTFNNMTNAVEGAVAVMSQFNLKAKDLEGALDSINSVAGSFAVEFDDIVGAIRRGGGAFAAAAAEGKSAQENLNEFVALFAKIRSSTRESSETIATGLRTITARLQKLSTQQGLKNILNVDLSENGEFVGTYEAIERIAGAIKELGISTQDVRFSQIVEQIGGIRQFSRVIPLITDATRTSEILAAAQESGGSTAKAAAEAQKTFRVQIDKTKESFIALAAAAAQGDALFGGFASLGAATKGLLAFSRSIMETAKTLTPLLPLLAGMAAIKFSRQTFGGGGKGVDGFGGIAGFLGGLGGGGGGGGGAGAPGGAGGAGQGGATNATQKLMAEVSKNTAAINKLTNAINTLSSKPGAAPFARGGVVPGSGNRDTVPAMLTPGEFVIRKNAVKALGTERLHKMNKYADGGPILKEDRVGALILSGNAGKVGTNTIDKDLILEQFGNDATKAKLKETIPDSKTFKLVRNPLSKDKAPTFTGAINAGLIQAVNTSAKKLGDDLKLDSTAISGKVDRRAFLSSVNDGARGNLFEQLIDAAAKSANSLYESSGAQDPFDFVGSLGDALDKLFPAVADIMYKDGKASYQAASPDDFAKKIGNQLLSEIGYTSGAVSKSLNTEASSAFENLKTSLGDRKEGKNKVKQLLAGGAKNAGKVEERIYNELLAAGYIIETPKATGQGFDVSIAKGYASGGSVSDTVPAMLTPGEFVINKRAAARIGGAQLERLNKADKIQGFNKGGSVGPIQKFLFGPGGGDLAYETLRKEADKHGRMFNIGIRDSIRELMEGIKKASKDAKKKFITDVGKLKGLDDAGRKSAVGGVVSRLASGAGGNFNDTQVAAATKQLLDGVEKGLDFSDIIDQNKELADIFQSTVSDATAYADAIKQLSAETGIATKTLTQISSFKNNQNQQFFSDEESIGKQFSGALSSAMPGLGKKFVESSFAKPFRFLAKANNIFADKLRVNFDTFLTGFTTAVSAGLATATEFFPELGNTAEGKTVKETAQSAASGAALGQTLGRLIAGPVGGAIGSAVGVIGGAISGYLKAQQNRALEEAQIGLTNTVNKLEKAMSNLASASVITEGLIRAAQSGIQNLTNEASTNLPVALEQQRSWYQFDAPLSNEAMMGVYKQTMQAAEAAYQQSRTYAQEVIAPGMTSQQVKDRQDVIAGGGSSQDILQGNATVIAQATAAAGGQEAFDRLSAAEQRLKKEEIINLQALVLYKQKLIDSGKSEEEAQQAIAENRERAAGEGRRLLIEQEQLDLATQAATLNMNSLNKEFKKFDIVLKSVRDQFAAFDAEAERLDKIVDGLTSSLAGTGTSVEGIASGRLSVLSNPSAYSIADYEQSAMDTGASPELVAVATASQRLQNQIIPMMRSNQFSSSDEILAAVDQMAQSLRGPLTAGAQQALDDLKGEVAQRFQGGADGGGGNVADLADKVDQIFSQTGKEAQEALVAIEQKRIDTILKQEKIIKQISALDQQRIAILTKGNNALRDFEVQLKEATSQTVSFEDMTNGFYQGLSLLTGGLTDIGDITADRDARSQNLGVMRQQYQALSEGDQNPNTQEQQGILLQQIQNEQAMIDRLTNAMQQIADDNTVQVAAFKKFTEKKEKAKSAKGVMDKLLSGDFEQIWEATQSINAAEAAMAGDSDYFASRPGSYNQLQADGILGMFSADTQNRMVDVAAQGAASGAGLGAAEMQMVREMNLEARGNPNDPDLQMAQQATRNMWAASQALEQSMVAQQAVLRDQLAIVQGSVQQGNQLEGSINRWIHALWFEYPRIVERAFDVVAWRAQGLNSGGVVTTGRGSTGGPNKDTVPAMLTPGEFVINREATKKHRGLIESINNGGPLYLATGGGPVRKTKQQIDQERRERAEAWKQRNRSSSQTDESRQKRRSRLASIREGRERIQGSRNTASTAPTPESIIQPGMGLLEFEDAFTRAFGPGLPEKHPRYQEYYAEWQRQKMAALDSRIEESKKQLQRDAQAAAESAQNEAETRARAVTAQLQQEKAERDRQKSADFVNTKAKMFAEEKGTLYTTLENGSVETWTSKDGKFTANGIFQGLTSKGGIKIRLEGNDEESGRQNGQIIVLDAQALDAASVARAGNGVDALYQQHRDIKKAQRKAQLDQEIEALRAEQAAKRQKETDRAKMAAEKQAASIQTSKDLFSATEKELNRLLNVEQSTLDANEETLKSKGFLGRMFGSGLQEGDIALAKQKITRYKTGLEKLAQARSAYGSGRAGMYNSVDLASAQEAFDAARRLAVMPAVMLGTGKENLNAIPTAGAGLKRVNTKEHNARVQEELNQIEAQKENAVNLTMAVAAPVAGLAAAPTAAAGALSAVSTVGTASAISNYDSYRGGMKTGSEALKDTAVMTGMSALGGAVAPAVTAAGAKLLKPVTDVIGKGVAKGAEIAKPYVGAGLEAARNTGGKALEKTLNLMGTSSKEFSDDLGKLAVALRLRKAPVPTGGQQTIGAGVKGQFNNSNSLIQVRGARPGATTNLVTEGAENFTSVIDDSMVNFDELAANFNMSPNTIAPKGGFAGGRANFGERMGGRLYRGADGSISTSMPGTAAPRGGNLFRAGVYSDEVLAPQSLIGKEQLKALAQERAVRQAAQIDEVLSAIQPTYGPFPAVKGSVGSSPTFKTPTQAKPVDFFGHGVDQAVVDDYLANATKPLSDYISPTNFGVAPDDLIGGDFGGSVTRSQIDAAVEQAQQGIKNRELMKMIKEATKPGFNIGRATLGTSAVGYGIKELGLINPGDIKDLPKLVTGFNKGGSVYANQGMFVPKGTDTVPAMLTPGEFVVNRKATQENRGLLEAINGGSPIYRRRGGPVYMEQGGEATGGGMSMNFNQFNLAVSNFTGSTAQFFTGTNNFVGGVASFAEKIGSFTTYVDKLSQLKLPSIPDKIEMVGTHSVTVEVRGTEVLQGMEAWAEQLVSSKISDKFRDLWEKTGGQVGSPR